MRKSRVFVLIAAIGALVIGLVFVGGQVVGCLGPLNVTNVQCIAAFNAAYDPDYAPGPAPGAWIAVSAALFLVALAAAPWRRPSLRAIGALTGAAIVGAVVGSVVYDVTRETSLTGPTSTGQIISVVFAPNTEARLLDVAIGLGVAVIGAAVFARTCARSGPERA